MTQTFVYNGKEVFLTGRTAIKNVRNSQKILYEIRLKKYLNDTSDSDITSDWVTMSELYRIVPEKESVEKKSDD